MTPLIIIICLVLALVGQKSSVRLATWLGGLYIGALVADVALWLVSLLVVTATDIPCADSVDTSCGMGEGLLAATTGGLIAIGLGVYIGFALRHKARNLIVRDRFRSRWIMIGCAILVESGLYLLTVRLSSI